MTLKELIIKYEFDMIVPDLLTINEPSKENLYAFKEAFDTLRRMAPGKTNGENIVITICEDWEDDVRGSEYLDASFYELQPWDSCLAKEIDCPSGIDEIKALAAILDRLTLWGLSFTQDHEDFQMTTRSKYEIKAEEKLKPIILEYVNYTEHMDFRFGTVFLTPKGKRELDNKRAHRNRPKRMRDARVYRAIKRLETEDKLSRFFADSSDKHDISPNSPENGHLFHAKEIKEFVFHSRTSNGTGRAAYIEELLTKYFQSDVNSFTSAKLMLTSSSASPITMIEGSQIIQKVHSVLRENTECGLHFGIKESLGIDIELRLLLSR